MALALGFALALGLAGIYQGKLKPIRNKWLLFLIGFLLINIWLCPKPTVHFLDMNVSGFWVWQPLAYILIFFLMFITLSSIDFDDKHKDIIFKVMSWCGFVMAIYCIVQSLNIDQFYNLAIKDEIRFIPSANITGTMGQPTIVSPFIAMIIPIALYLKRYWFVLIMGIAVLLTRSQVAIGAMILSLLFLYSLKNKKTFIRTGILFLIIIALSITAYFSNPKIKSLVKDSGRFENWQQIIKDVNSPLAPEVKNRYPFTGLGIGSFKYIYHIKNHNTFWQAHNEYLEIPYNIGIIGLFLFLMALWVIIKDNLFKDRYRRYLLASFICIAICAGGTFVWQMGPHLYYSIGILGLLNNKGVNNVIRI